LIVTKDLTLVTGIGSPLLWDAVIRLARDKRVDLASLITHRFPLECHDQALALAANPEQAVKVVLCP
jgi:threonine dehydrogenase-like Zn-dependent dehydrogenase